MSTKKKPTIPCPRCGKPYRFQAVLDRHLRMHCRAVVDPKENFNTKRDRDQETKPDHPMADPMASPPEGWKPILVRCGSAFISPSDVSCVKEAKRGLFVVTFRDNPNPEWPLWLREEEVGELLRHFEVKG